MVAIYSLKHRHGDPLNFIPCISLEEKGGLNNFECDMVIGVRWTGLNILITADLHGFTWAYKEW